MGWIHSKKMRSERTWSPVLAAARTIPTAVPRRTSSNTVKKYWAWSNTGDATEPPTTLTFTRALTGAVRPPPSSADITMEITVLALPCSEREREITPRGEGFTLITPYLPAQFDKTIKKKKVETEGKDELSWECFGVGSEDAPGSVLTPSVAVTVKSNFSDPSSRSRAVLVQICPVSLSMVKAGTQDVGDGAEGTAILIRGRHLREKRETPGLNPTCELGLALNPRGPPDQTSGYDLPPILPSFHPPILPSHQHIFTITLYLQVHRNTS
ncbi:hypothetical protein EYF80_042837 [Liparis tanakae]|uniref:Uncharacterized protein n=1 Tax=Liparis tanakae TaxID=230148 RepID=A0A4Z2G055_9TELE|nr:hypothetical protein EYF80_042837 [Liparis tanakae]